MAYVCVVLTESLPSSKTCRTGIETTRAQQWHNFKIAVRTCVGPCQMLQECEHALSIIIPDEDPVPLSCIGLRPLTN